MTDEELLLWLRLEDTSLTDFAADRIEVLEAKLATCEKYRDAYAECDRIGTQAVRDLEAKLAKAVELLTLCRDMLGEVASPSDPLSVMLNETLAEIKGDKP